MSGSKRSNCKLSEAQALKTHNETMKKIEAEKRRQREIQIQNEKKIEDEKCQQLEIKIQNAINELNKRRIIIEKYKASVIVEHEKILPKTSALKEFLDYKSFLINKIDSQPKSYKIRKSDSMQKYLDGLFGFLGTMQPERDSKLNQLISDLQGQIDEKRRSLDEKEYFDSVKNLENKKRKQYNYNKSSEDSTKISVKLEQAFQEFKIDVEPYLDIPELAEDKQFSNLISSFDQVATIKKNNPKNALNKIKLIHEDFSLYKPRLDQILKNRQESIRLYQSLLNEHIALSKLMNQKPIVSKHINTSIDDDIKQLTEFNKQLTEKLIKQEESAYVKKTVDDIMKDMGHKLLASQTLKSVNQQHNHELYSFGEKTGINVFMSDDGAVMFEVSGISEGTKPYSDYDKLIVKEDMEEFCDEYDIIKKKLKDRGVEIEVSSEKLLPADEKYVRFIDVSSMTRHEGETSQRENSTKVSKKIKMKEIIL